MAVPPVFDSDASFVVVGGGSDLSFLSKDDSSCGREEETDSLVQVIAPHLSRVMQHGTAKHVVGEGGEDKPCLSIVAQAERKTALQKYNTKTFSSMVHPSPPFPAVELY